MFYIIFITAGLGILGWIKGFRNSDYIPSDLSVKFLSRTIRPPIFFFLLCGAPKSKKYPVGVMTAWAFLFQSLGIGLIIHTIYYVFFAQSLIEVLLNLIYILAIVYGLTYWLTINHKYDEF